MCSESKTDVVKWLRGVEGEERTAPSRFGGSPGRGSQEWNEGMSEMKWNIRMTKTFNFHHGQNKKAIFRNQKVESCLCFFTLKILNLKCFSLNVTT